MLYLRHPVNFPRFPGILKKPACNIFPRAERTHFYLRYENQQPVFHQNGLSIEAPKSSTIIKTNLDKQIYKIIPLFAIY